MSALTPKHQFGESADSNRGVVSRVIGKAMIAGNGCKWQGFSRAEYCPALRFNYFEGTSPVVFINSGLVMLIHEQKVAIRTIWVFEPCDEAFSGCHQDYFRLSHRVNVPCSCKHFFLSFKLSP